jgi:hypothetical protein
VKQLEEILIEGGNDALRRELEKLDRGSISPTGRVGNDLAVVRVRKTDAGQKIILVTARTMPMFELYHGGRSRDYSVGWIELDVDEKGRGQGRVIAGGRLKITPAGVLEVESFGLQPIRLMNVRRWD